MGALAGVLSKLIGKNLIKFMKPMFSKITKVGKFAGSSVLGGLLGKGLIGRSIGGLLGKILGTGVFGSLLTGVVSMTKSVGLNEDQLAPELSQAITKNEIRYYEKRVQDYKPIEKQDSVKIEYNPFTGVRQEVVNNETNIKSDSNPELDELNFKLDQAKLTLNKQEKASKNLDLSKDGITKALGTLLGVLQVIPGLITTSISNLFGSKDDAEKDNAEESNEEDTEVEELDEEKEEPKSKSSIGSTIGGLAGGVLGSFLGGPLLGGTAGYFIGDKLGSYVDSYIDSGESSKKVEPMVRQDNRNSNINIDSYIDSGESSKKVEPMVQQDNKNSNIKLNYLNNNSKEPNVSQFYDKGNRTIEKQPEIQYDKLAESFNNYNNSLESKDKSDRLNPQIKENVTIVNIPTKETIIVKSDSISDRYK